MKEAMRHPVSRKKVRFEANPTREIGMLLLIGMVAILLTGCDKSSQPAKPPLTFEEVEVQICGDYLGWYYKGNEYFEIRTNGTFSQTFVRKGVTNYVLHGKWWLSERDGGYAVDFEPFMDLRDSINQGIEPEKIRRRVASYHETKGEIYFVPDLAYYIVRMRTPNAATNRIAK